MCPIQNHPEQSFNGDGVLLGPVTTLEHRELQASIERKIDSLGGLFLGALSLVGTSTSPQTISASLSGFPAGFIPPIPLISSGPSSLSYSCPAPLPIDQNRFLAPESSTCARKAAPKAAKALPMQGVKIPDLPTGGWRIAVSQWEAPDEKTLAEMGGRALKDWPEDWYKGCNKTLYGAKRGQRELIARGYSESVIHLLHRTVCSYSRHISSCNRDGNIFEATYPTKSIRKLLLALRSKYSLSRASKNGLPAERTSAVCAA
jgi:hypothetical protein